MIPIFPDPEVFMMDDTDYAEHLLLRELEDDDDMKQPISSNTLSTLCSGTAATMTEDEDMDDLSFFDEDPMGLVNESNEEQNPVEEDNPPMEDRKPTAKSKNQEPRKSAPKMPAAAQASKRTNTSSVNSTQEEDKTTSDEPIRVDMPSKFDILCGQSRICASHTGNRRFQVVLDIYAPKYDAATSKQEKMTMTKEIVSCIHQAGGRFLKYKEGQWEEISNVTARDKVSHALRTKVASWKRQQQEKKDARRGSTGSKPSHRRGKQARSRRSSESSVATSASDIVTASFDGSDSASANVMDELIKAQREIFASLTAPGSQNGLESHPLQKKQSP